MPGANYMGGKRNTVKLKLKDTTRRAQRGFFRRQRLEILSKGLTLDSKSAGNNNRKRSEIGLSHAKAKADRPHDTNSPRAAYYLGITSHPSPTDDQEFSYVHVRNVDTGLPDCMGSLRSMCNRILAVPNLAGLHHYETPCKRPSSTRTHSKGTSEVTSNQCYRPLRDVISLEEHRSQEGEIQPSLSSAIHEGKIATSRSSSSHNETARVDFTTSSGEVSTQSAVHDEDPFPRASTNRPGSIPRYDNAVTRSRSLSTNSSPFTWSETSPASPLAAVASFHQGTSSDLFSYRSGGSPERLPGCIFDYEDPWDAIGMIMGLPQSNSKETTLEEELENLGAAGFHPCATPSNDVVWEDIHIEGYSDERTSSTLVNSEDEIPKYESLKISDVQWGDTSVDIDDNPFFDESEYSRDLFSSKTWLNSDYKDIFDSDGDHVVPETSSRAYDLRGEFYRTPFGSSTCQTLKVEDHQEQLEPLVSNLCYIDDVPLNANLPIHELYPPPVANHFDDVVNAPRNNVDLEYGTHDSRETKDVLPEIVMHPPVPEHASHPVNDVYYGPRLFTDNSDDASD